MYMHFYAYIYTLQEEEYMFLVPEASRFLFMLICSESYVDIMLGLHVDELVLVWIGKEKKYLPIKSATVSVITWFNFLCLGSQYLMVALGSYCPQIWNQDTNQWVPRLDGSSVFLWYGQTETDKPFLAYTGHCSDSCEEVVSSHSVNIIWLLILSQVQNGGSLLVPVKQKATFPSELEDVLVFKLNTNSLETEFNSPDGH